MSKGKKFVSRITSGDISELLEVTAERVGFCNISVPDLFGVNVDVEGQETKNFKNGYRDGKFVEKLKEEKRYSGSAVNRVSNALEDMGLFLCHTNFGHGGTREYLRNVTGDAYRISKK